MRLRKKIRETPFTVVTNNIKHLGVDLTKQVNDLYYKYFKSLKKDNEEDLVMDWQDLYSKNGRFAIQWNSLRTPTHEDMELERANLQIHLE